MNHRQHPKHLKRSQAAQSCFGKDSWSDDVPIPYAWLEFDVENVEKTTAELASCPFGKPA